MPAPKRALPLEFEEHATIPGKIRCVICKEVDPLGLGRYIAKGSGKSHLASETHAAHVQVLQMRKEENDARQRTSQAIYSGPDIRPDPLLYRPNNSGYTGMFCATAGSEMDLPLESGVASVFDEPTIPMFIDPIVAHDPQAERERLAEQLANLLLHAEELDEFGENHQEDDVTAPNFVGNQDHEEAEPMDEDTTQDPRYTPYPSKILMLLDILDNLPRLRISNSQLEMILWLLKQLNVPNVPTIKSLRKMQSRLRQLCGSEPAAYTSSMGNRFFVNDVRESVAKDFANPEVVKHLNFYPEETSGPISEVWQAQRWKEYTPAELTPMFSHGLRQFWINEVAELDTGQKVLPVALLKRGGVLCADYFDVSPSPVGWHIHTTKRSLPVSRLAFNYDDVIQRVGDQIRWAEGAVVPQMPNPLRPLADGDDLYVVMLPLWADDVSGNKSKQYNKHINIYMANSNLPGQLLQQEYFVRFVSTSPNATSPEQLSAIKEQIQDTHQNPIKCFNAETQRNCRVILRVPGLPADNPQQAEEASHMGGNANMLCRRCMVGGTHKETETDAGYHALYCVGIARTAAETKKTLLKQLDFAMHGFKSQVEHLQTATGVKDKVAQHWIEILLKKATILKRTEIGKSPQEIADELRVWFDEQPGDKVNPLLDIAGLDPNRDTPVEILHTILLGIVKYVWHMLHTSWSSTEQDQFVVGLQSTDIDGLTVPPIRAAYMMQYKNNLIGKHFKTLMQTMVFHVHDLVSPEQFNLVKAVCALGSVLWVSEIDNMKEYTVRMNTVDVTTESLSSTHLSIFQEDLEILIGNVLDAFGDNDPAKIIKKIKIHLLPHIISDVKRFGPAIRNSTEVYEGFNGIFRLCSILSNHQAPSRDIALKFASMDRLKHILSGGYWREGNGWIHAGSKVLEVLKTMPIIQRHLGWAPPKKVVPGHIRAEAKKSSLPLKWTETEAFSAKLTDIQDFVPDETKWHQGISFTAQSGDACKKKSWICAHDASDNVLFGRVACILSPEKSTTSGIVVLDHFVVSERLHPRLDVPVLYRPPAPESQRIIVETKAVLFRFSAQHDCKLANCQPTASRAVIQEHVETSRTIPLLEHSDDLHFVVNTHALHNATLLRRVLSRALTLPRPLYSDREARHAEQAIQLRSSQDARRAQTKERRRQTQIAKKAAQDLFTIEEESDSAPVFSDGEIEGDGEVESRKRKRS